VLCQRASLLTSFAVLACAVGTDPRTIDDRIEGGVRVDIDDYPHQVSVQTAYGHRCGGSILAETWVLTAAHCVADLPDDLAVGGGVTRLSELERGEGSSQDVARVVLHPEYDPEAAPPRNDLALLRLVDALDPSRVAAIPLVGPDDADAGLTDPGVLATATGWGALYEGGSLPDGLRAVDLPIVSNTTAARAYGRTLGPDHIAAGWVAEGGHATCGGDSGGPLVVANDDGDQVLAGVISWGGDCDQSDLPGIYARVSHAHAWIESTMMDEDDAGEWFCADDELLCDESWCVPWDWTCDGYADCDDETDEEDC
jgi:secreted trypsin-like serine protease